MQTRFYFYQSRYSGLFKADKFNGLALPFHTNTGSERNDQKCSVTQFSSKTSELNRNDSKLHKTSLDCTNSRRIAQKTLIFDWNHE